MLCYKKGDTGCFVTFTFTSKMAFWVRTWLDGASGFMPYHTPGLRWHLADRSIQLYAHTTWDFGLQQQIKHCIPISCSWLTWEWLEATARFSFSLFRDGGWRLAFWASRPFALCALVSRRSVSGTSSLQSRSTQEEKNKQIIYQGHWSLWCVLVNVLQITQWKSEVCTSILI